MSRRGPYAKGVAKREEILRTALEVVDRNGMRGTSVRELAAAVDLTQAGLLHHFGSKEELFLAILAVRDDEDLQGADGVDIIDQFLLVTGRNAQTPGMVQLFTSTASAATSDPAHPAHAWFAERYVRVRTALADAMRQRQAIGEMPGDVDAEQLAAVMTAVSDGMQLQWMLDPTTDMAAHVRLVWELALRRAPLSVTG
ncbi:TetR/AcrR family transcriptional regulator [Frigoribacterium sp. CFBP 13729]|uniref:TetR/AcrR family transcriptional regulator n=1 Tax=unclassified Frigoribacterium TaxID=2627005 RepID=UPI0017829ED7|nr:MULTISPECIES: TetR/AcrR family transcriptional regulator [unclassified Frigoribacterium]MBD8585492.1 TetR/AcrR family transcriptional regulator [Frigoribacterium sp. CFBP 8766]MBD8610045.1 TetR/AcrR family transcriptional regulator [Frigoribacterium sp. CFBP 13729]